MSRELPLRTPAKNSPQILPPNTLAKYSCQILLFTIKEDIILTNTNISHTLLPSQPQTDHTIITKMVPYEAFACRCGAEDVVLRESYKPKTRGSSSTPIYSPRSSSTPIYSLGSSTPPRYSPGASTPQSYYPGTSRNAECSNCKHLLGKIMVLKATVEMYMHSEEHTLNSAALLHEVYNDMGKLGLE
ncbi:hypothetical protein Tco_1171791 [Tanacetum coccineum]